MFMRNIINSLFGLQINREGSEHMEDLMEIIRKEYEGFGLDDNQIIAAVNVGLKPEQLKSLAEHMAIVGKKLIEIYDQIIQALRGFCDSDEFKKQMASISNINLLTKTEDIFPLKNEIKPWKKKKFYQ